MIEEFGADVCLLELDNLRFSRLISARRALPWPYAPTRGKAFRPSPVQKAVRDVLFSGLGAASAATGLADDDAGDEFFQAFQAAESSGALILPGDVPVSSAIDGLATSFRRGLAQPVGQLVDGFRYLARAVGLAALPEKGEGASLRIRGIFVPSALAVDGGGRAAPLARAVLVGAVAATALNFALTGGLDPSPDDGRLTGADVSLLPVLLLALLFGGLLASAFVLAFLRSRDEAMAVRLRDALELRARLGCREQPDHELHFRTRTQSEAGNSSSSLHDRSPGGTDQALQRPLWCRWVKRTWAAFAPPPSADGRQELPEAMTGTSADGTSQAGGQGARLPTQGVLQQPWQLPVRPRPSSRPSASWLVPESGVKAVPQDAWTPLFTVRRPLGEGETRRLSLFEPRFLRLFDSLKAAGATKPGLKLAVVFAPLGSERPLSLRQAPEGERGLQPALSVEVDAVLEERGRIVEVDTIHEALGEDGQRRWRLEVRGTERTFHTRSCSLSSDEFGALWAAPAATGPADVATARLHADAHVSPGQIEASPVRCVVVVGLLHVNGIVSRLNELLLERPR